VSDSDNKGKAPAAGAGQKPRKQGTAVRRAGAGSSAGGGKRPAGGRRPAGRKGARQPPPSTTATVVRALSVVLTVLVVVGGVAGIAIYQNNVAPFQTAVLKVDDAELKMGYFLKRVRLSGQEPLTVLQELTREMIIDLVAPNPPYDIVLTDEDVDQFARELASAGGAPINDLEFREWYRQQVNDSGLDDDEFRDLLRRNLLSLRMGEYLGDRMPTVVEQVHLHMIAFGSYEDALEIKERLDAGEDFHELAREHNQVPDLKQSGGDLGWLPRAALLPNIAGVAFDQLAVGEASQPLALSQASSQNQAFAVILVSERADARQVEGDALAAVRASALPQWFSQEYQYHTVEFHGFNNGYDSETDAWVRWQLARMSRHDQPREPQAAGP
jgi:parvulin-like peptidyl-prolyl isomerase